MLDDVLAEQLGVAPERVELQAKVLDEAAVCAVRGQPHAVPGLLQLQALRGARGGVRDASHGRRLPTGSRIKSLDPARVWPGSSHDALSKRGVRMVSRAKLASACRVSLALPDSYNALSHTQPCGKE